MATRRTEGGVPASESACGQRGVPASESACGQRGVPASESACGQGLRTGAHLRCFPSRRCAAGPVHEATGGYAVRSPCPSGIPRPRHKALSMVLQRFLSLVLHRFLISGPDLGIDVGFCLFMHSCVHRFLISGPDLRITASFSQETGQKAAVILDFRPKLANHCRVPPAASVAAANIRVQF